MRQAIEEAKNQESKDGEKPGFESSNRRSMMMSQQEMMGSKDGVNNQGPGSVRMIRYIKNNV